ncbi:colanic acid/amylovoran biosynthesis protein [Flavobacterium arsenatis]|uniref:Colanic acid/amylovoran biosynthesis protein n=1 Tax=Flavobacterium arsenatis TaxID=1484332 RepID=A0ABU1TLZ3_9FLAO|nr:polysaccharide pyruvyl transferase family protein [Flavobacterium arsenatis]MDR6966989.1 colanic acid/amylovoran biosynthesis protein [Flavobacterium arsenatis]
MRIFVTGQTSVHWGRKEFGNIGNYYVTESFFRQIHLTFPDASVYTTIQLTDEFCLREKVKCVPLELYYNWSEDDLSNALLEYAIADIYNKTGKLIDTTPFIDEVLKSDLVIDHSGDMWGQNADLAGENRFIVGVLKNRTIQLLGKKNVLLGCSPGPFNDEYLPIVKEALINFDVITTRDGLSKSLLKEAGLPVDNVKEYTCPSYLYKGDDFEIVKNKLENTLLYNKSKPIIGINICGWNMEQPPFSKWPRANDEYDNFIGLIEFITQKLDVNVMLLSHSNGFLMEPEFKLIHGRDFPILKQLYDIIQEKSPNDKLFLLDGVYTPGETKSIISQFDLFISGRLHGAVAGLSQSVPTIIIDYGHEPKAHKLRGFAKQLDLIDCVVDPNNLNNMIDKVDEYWSNREKIKNHLDLKLPEIRLQAQNSYKILKELVNN